MEHKFNHNWSSAARDHCGTLAARMDPISLDRSVAEGVVRSAGRVARRDGLRANLGC